MTKYLFIGGSKDGEMMEVPADRQIIQVIAPESRPWAVGVPTASTELDYEVETYTRQRLRGENETFEVFAPSDWRGDKVIRHLLNAATKDVRVSLR